MPRTELSTHLDNYRDTVNTALDAVNSLLAEGKYEDACTVMTQISRTQARASLEMRTILLRNGHIKEELD